MLKGRKPYLDAILKEHVRSQAQLLEENGYNRKQIAEILHFSESTIGKLLGNLSPEKLSAARSKNAKRWHGRRGPQSEEEKLQRRVDRAKLKSGQQAAKLRGEVVDNERISAELHALFRYDSQGCSNDSIIHSTSDMMSALRSQFDDSEIRLSGNDISIRPLESDDVRWVDEDEPEWPHQPSRRYYARYSTIMRHYRERQAMAANNKKSPSFGGSLSFNVDRESR